jgi:hypothetical protein
VLAVESDGVAKANARLDELTRASKTAETQSRQMTKGFDAADTEVRKFSRGTDMAAADARRLSKAIGFAETEAYRMAKAVDSADNKAREFSRGTEAAAADARRLSASIGFAETEAYQMAKAMDRAGTSTTTAGQKMRATGKTSNVVRGNFGAMKGATQQLSFQLQDVAVQAQAGTSAFIILGQQGPQIASIFGPGGAVFGVLIAVGSMIAGVLYNSIKTAEGGVDELEESLSRLEGQVVRNTGGVLEFTRKLEAMAKISSAAAAAQIVSGMTDARVAITGSTKAIDGLVAGLTGVDLSKVNDDIARLRREGFTDADFAAPVQSFTNAVSDVTPAISEVSAALGISTVQALAFVQAAGSLNPRDAGTYSAFRDTVDEITVAQRNLSPVMANFYRDMAQNDGTIRDAGQSLSFFKKQLREVMAGGSLSGSIEGDADAQAALIKKLAEAKDRQDKTDADKLARKQKEGADADSREMAAASTKFENMSISAGKYLDQVTMLGLTEEQAFTERQTRISTRLKTELDQRTLTESQYEDGIAALKRDADMRDLAARSGYLMAWQETTLAAISTIDTASAGMAQNLTVSMATAFDSFILGTASAKDSFSAFASSMAASLVGALTQMAAQWIAYQLVQKVAGKAGQASAASAMSLNAGASVAMSGLNAFSSTAAIPIVGPALAGPAAAAAIAATTPMAATVTALTAAAVGARAVGGQVRGGESYLVGERGPELLHMGTSGRVVPNDKIGGSGGGVTIINNIDASGGGADVDIKIRQAMIQTNRQTVAQIQDLVRRGRFA